MAQNDKPGHGASESTPGPSGESRTHENRGERSIQREHPAARNLAREDEQYLRKHAGELSKSTLRAKWIHSPEDHEDHPGQSLATRNHEVIRPWAEARHALPGTVPGTEHGGRPGVLRFDFPGYGGQALEVLDWEEWFRTFDERQLVFVYQEHKSDGHVSNFFRFDNPEREDA